MKKLTVVGSSATPTGSGPTGLVGLPDPLPRSPDMADGSELLIEHVLAAVMQPGTTATVLAGRLRQSAGHVRVVALIRALLVADQIIRDTFEPSQDGRPYAELARGLALHLTALLDDAEMTKLQGDTVTLDDLAS